MKNKLYITIHVYNGVTITEMADTGFFFMTFIGGVENRARAPMPNREPICVRDVMFRSILGP